MARAFPDAVQWRDVDTCLSDDAVADWLEGRLAMAARDQAAAHIDSCPSCRELLAGAALAQGVTPNDSATQPILAEGPPLLPGDRVGRYQIVGPAGAGAMGVVWLAHDPELKRRVALKLQRPTQHGAEHQRLLVMREAQAMARLSHPNTVAVHEVGTHGEQVFLAMEYVEGQTLREWLHATARTPEQVVEAFVQAGRGLAAAHASGLVHRDFKPDNVLVDGGRVRVTDFGLAREPESQPRAAGAPQDPLGGLTRTGALVGTPAYMAPELLTGKSAADARSDQFSFCVSLYEALAGARPFAGRTAEELAQACARGELQPWPRGAPERVRKALVRGLRAEPAERHASMDELLRALGERPRNLAPLFAVGAAVLAALGLFGLRPVLVCDPLAAQAQSAFDPAQRAATRKAFLATGRPNAAAAFAALEARFNRYLDALSAASVSVCKARARRGDPDGALALRASCLERRQAEVAALGQVLATGDAGLLAGTGPAFDRLKPVAACAEARGLHAEPPLPKDRAELTRLWGELARATALLALWQGERGLVVARPAAEAAHALGHAPLEAQLLYVRGTLERAAEQNTASVETLVSAAALSAQAGDDQTEAESFLELARVSGVGLTRYTDGLHAVALAEAPVHRLGDPPHLLGWLLQDRCNILWLSGHFEESVPHCRRSLEVLQGCEGCSSLRLRSEELLANAEQDLGHDEAAIAGHRRVAAERERAASPYDASFPNALINVVADLIEIERFAEALPVAERVLALRVEQGYADGYAQHRIAAALRGLGRLDEALAHDRESRRILESTRGAESRWVIYPLSGEGLDLLALGRPREALEPLERAEALGARLGQPELQARVGLSQALWQTGGDKARALRLAREARDLQQAQAKKYGGHYQLQLAHAQEWLAQIDR